MQNCPFCNDNYGKSLQAWPLKVRGPEAETSLAPSKLASLGLT